MNVRNRTNRFIVIENMTETEIYTLNRLYFSVLMCFIIIRTFAKSID